MWLVRVLSAAVMIPFAAYFYFYLRRMANWLGADTKKKTVKGILLLCCFGVLIISFCMWTVGLLALMHIMMLAFAMEALNGILYLIGGRKKRDLRLWKQIYRSGLVPVIGAVLILGYGYWNIGQVREKEYSIETEKEIREEGYRLAVISDLHFGNAMDTDELELYCREIEQKSPDMVLLCGDIVDESTSMIKMRQAFLALGGIESEYGTFFVYGNHDRADYSKDPNYTGQDLEEALDAAGVHVLRDERYQVNDEFIIIGREDYSHARRGGMAESGRSDAGEPENGLKSAAVSDHGRLSVEELVEGADRNAFLLLLDHQPEGLWSNSLSGCDLQLSGHTHKGQIWPGGQLSTLFGFGDLNYGYQRFNNLQVIVTSGMSGWGFPFRTSGHSEYLIVTVNAESQLRSRK